MRGSEGIDVQAKSASGAINDTTSEAEVAATDVPAGVPSGQISRRVTRRALLTAGAASLAAVAAGAIAAPVQVAAANGDPIRIGQANAGTTPTWLNSTSYPALGASTTSGDGLDGASAGGGSGVYGHTTGAAGFGVFGRNEVTANIGYVGGPKDGSAGSSTVAGYAGVRGLNTHADGVGLWGENTVHHTIGVIGGKAALGGVALQPGTLGLSVLGHVAFSGSGILTIAAGKSSAKISGIPLVEDCFVLATLQQYRAGVYVAASVPSVTGQSITIYLNAKVTTAIKVAWIVLDKFTA